MSRPTVCDPMDRSTPGFPVLHHLLELAQTHVHRVSDAIQPSCPLLPTSPPLSLSQHLRLFQWVNSSHQVVTVLELQLQHQSFQWTSRTDSFRVNWCISLRSLGLPIFFPLPQAHLAPLLRIHVFLGNSFILSYSALWSLLSPWPCSRLIEDWCPGP